MSSEEHIGKHAKHAKVPEIPVEEEVVAGAHAATQSAVPDNVPQVIGSMLEGQETLVIAPPGMPQSSANDALAASSDQVEAAAISAEGLAAAETTLIDTEALAAAETTVIDADEVAEAQQKAKFEIPVIDEFGEEVGDESDGEGADEPDGEGADELDAEGAAFAPTFEEVPKHTARKVLKGIGIGLGVLVGIAAIVYVAGIAVFSNWFMPGTSVGPLDVSWKSSDEAAQMLDEYVSDYKVDVLGGTFSYRTDAEKLGLVANSRTIVQSMHDNMESWRWPVLLWEGAHDETDCITLTYLESTAATDVKAAIAAYNEGARPPENARVVYNDQVDGFVVQPEVAGTQYQPDQVAAALDAGVKSLAPKVELAAGQLIQPTVLSTDPKLTKAATDATKMITAHLKLSLEGVDGGEIGPDQLHTLVSISDTGEAKLDEEALMQWVSQLTEGYNTVGTERTYTRPDGKVITVDGGEYGWEVDAEALRDEILEGVKAGATKTIEVPCSMVGEAWNGVGQVDWGNRYIDVDLSEQYVRFYDDNAEIIWESDCITGAPDGMHNTVEGVWYVTGKESPSKLVGWEYGKKIYETYVRWWMPFEGNGIGFHDADWQPAFGGYMYASGYGSHGCVNLPVDAAEELWYIIEVNDVVIVHW